MHTEHTTLNTTHSTDTHTDIWTHTGPETCTGTLTYSTQKHAQSQTPTYGAVNTVLTDTDTDTLTQ